MERQQGSADCALHGLLQGRQRLALAALLQVQRGQLAEGQASRQQRAVLPRRAGQPVQAPGGFLRASFAALRPAWSNSTCSGSSGLHSGGVAACPP